MFNRNEIERDHDFDTENQGRHQDSASLMYSKQH